MSRGWMFPVAALPDGRKARISNEFRRGAHDGVDITYPRRDEPIGLPEATKGSYMPTGVIAVAVLGGQVIYAYQHANGWRVRIHHEDGTDTSYFHLSWLAQGIEPGALVVRGQALGAIGDDPTVDDIRHLHLEWRDRANNPMDPTAELGGATHGGRFVAVLIALAIAAVAMKGGG